MNTSTPSKARSRILALADAGSFVEIGAGITAKTSDKKAASDGVITGYAVIAGRPVYIYSQDASVLGGTLGEMHAGKIVRIYEMALKTGAPVVGFLDCGGTRLGEAQDALNAFGSIYDAAACASGVIPQIAIVSGNCGGGMSIIPALSDFVFVDEKEAKLFLNSPNAIPGNHISKCDTSSPEFRKDSDFVDFVGNAADIIGMVRSLIELMPSNNEDDMGDRVTADDMNRACSGLEAFAADPYCFAAEVADNHVVFESKPGFAPDMVTVLGSLGGITVGFVGNRTRKYEMDGSVSAEYEPLLSVCGAKKAVRFISMCDAFSIPVISLVNVKGMDASEYSEKNMPKVAAKLIYTFSQSTTPKISLITGEAYGTAYHCMNSKACGADMVFAYENARAGLMDSKAAARIEGIDQKEAEERNSLEAAAAKGLIDDVILAADTRKYLIGAVEMLFTKREDGPMKKHGSV